MPSEGRSRITIDSPVGPLVAAACDAGLTHLQLSGLDRLPAQIPPRTAASSRHLEAAAAALGEYFDGARKHFDDLVLAPSGTEFQRRVWDALREIPYGTAESYGALARRIGRPTAARAVGMANNRNPIGIVVPCHRVIGSGGKLVGYAGGLDMKRWLLTHEGALDPEIFDAPSARTSRPPTRR